MHKRDAVNTAEKNTRYLELLLCGKLGDFLCLVLGLFFLNTAHSMWQAGFQGAMLHLSLQDTMFSNTQMKANRAEDLLFHLENQL